VRETLHTLGRNVVGSLESRLDLFGIELADERRRLASLIFLGSGVAMLLQLTLFFAGLAVLFAFENAPTEVVAAWMALGFFLLAVVCVLVGLLVASRSRDAFAETRAVLREDRELFTRDG